MSPAGVALALQMVASGAKGTTATQLAHVLHLPDAAGAAPAARRLLDSLGTVAADQRNTLRVANTVWVQQGMAVRPSFAAALRSQFDTAVRSADFSGNPGAATDRIDATVSDQTHGMIPNLFPAGALADSTRMVLVDAVYLAASWATAFDPKLTAPGAFTKADGTVERVPMMAMDQDPDGAGPPRSATRRPRATGP